MPGRLWGTRDSGGFFTAFGSFKLHLRGATRGSLFHFPSLALCLPLSVSQPSSVCQPPTPQIEQKQSDYIRVVWSFCSDVVVML